MSWFRCLLMTICLAVAFGFSATAHADKEKAKELFKRGMAQYKLEHYDEAITEFAAAYEEEQSPVLLFNIAQSHRLAKRPKLALNFYRKYLRDMPEAQNRAQVEQEMAGLEVEVQRLDAEAAERQRQLEAEQAIRQRQPAAAEKPKWPLWVGIGVGAAAVVGGAIAVGVVLSQPSVPSLGLESAR